MKKSLLIAVLIFSLFITFSVFAADNQYSSSNQAENPTGIPYSGGLDEIASPASYSTDELVEETFGSWSEVWSCNDGSRGNIFYVDSTVNLHEHRLHIEFVTAQSVCFFVYQGVALHGSYTLIDSVSFPSAGPGNQFYSSGVRDVELTQGFYYLIGTAWPIGATYARGGPTPPVPCSFGNLSIAVPLTVTGPYPLTQSITFTNTYMCPAYHQVIVTGTLAALSLTLTPINPPIIIPAGGGNFVFDASIVNTTNAAVNFDAWTEVILPNSVVYGPLIERFGLSIPGNATIMRQLTQAVPGIAPAGNYEMVGNVRVLPDSIVVSSSFPFTKLAGEDAPTHNQGWSCYGWDDEKSQIENHKSQITNLAASPNPFNASTVARFEMRDASQVKLAIYDIAGRKIAVLAEGFYQAGTHQAVWDASSMASGVYFARLQVGDEVATAKLLLVK